MTRLARFCSVSIVIAVGCGEKNPVAPVPSPRPASVSVRGPATVYLDGVERLLAAATLFDGSTRDVAGTWVSDTPTVVEIRAGNWAAGVASGEAVVTVEYEGLRDSATIRALPRYGPRHVGSYSVRSCSSSGAAWARACLGAFAVGTLVPISLDLTPDHDVVNGQATVDSIISDPFRAVVGLDGTLRIETMATSGSRRMNQVWSLSRAPQGFVTGTVEITHTDDVVGPGHAAITAAVEIDSPFDYLPR